MASKTVANTASELIGHNLLRRSWIVQNEDTSLNCFIKFERDTALTVSTTDHDHRLGPAGLIVFNDQQDGPDQVTGRWTIIAESGTPRISFFETESVKR